TNSDWGSNQSPDPGADQSRYQGGHDAAKHDTGSGSGPGSCPGQRGRTLYHETGSIGVSLSVRKTALQLSDEGRGQGSGMGGVEEQPVEGHQENEHRRGPVWEQ